MMRIDIMPNLFLTRTSFKVRTILKRELAVQKTHQAFITILTAAARINLVLRVELIIIIPMLRWRS